MLIKVKFTRDELRHLLCLFNISHFSSINCSEVMTKRTQEDSGEEWVTAKSRPMMILIAKVPSTLSCSASQSSVKKSYESQSLWSAKAEKYDRTVKPVVGPWQVTRQATTSDLLKARTQHAAQDGTMTKLDLLKSGNLMNWRMIERGNPLFALGQEHTSFNPVSTGKPVGNSSIKRAKTDSNCRHQSRSDQYWSRSIKQNTFWFQCHVVHLWG